MRAKVIQFPLKKCVAPPAQISGSDRLIEMIEGLDPWTLGVTLKALREIAVERSAARGAGVR